MTNIKKLVFFLADKSILPRRIELPPTIKLLGRTLSTFLVPKIVYQEHIKVNKKHQKEQS